jgi:hypothetical protein
MALCSIGALYCFERDHATKLHSIAVTLVMQVSPKQIHAESENLLPELPAEKNRTAAAQTVLLCLLFPAWGEDRAFLRSHLWLHHLLADVHPVLYPLTGSV